MGTNYYAQLNTCPYCSRGERLHLGKSSAGWRFLFRGWRGSDWDDGPEEPIRSWQAWKAVLRQPGAVVVDEYDRAVEAEEFIHWVEVERAEAGHTGQRSDPAGWLDDEGWEFDEREFS